MYGIKNAKDVNKLYFLSNSVAIHIGIATANLTYKGKLMLVDEDEFTAFLIAALGYRAEALRGGHCPFEARLPSRTHLSSSSN